MEPISTAAAFDAGGQAAQNATDRFRKNVAFNALQRIYGPVAGDPDTAAKLQAYQTSTVQDPLKTQGLALANDSATLANAGQAEQNNYNLLADPLKLKGAGLANDAAAQANTTAVDQDPLKTEGLRLGNETTRLNNQGQATQNAGTADALTAERAAKDRATTTGILSALTDTVNNGGDVGAAFDQYAPTIAALEGVDPNHMKPLRDKLVADPVGTINAIQQALAAANPQPAGTGSTAAQRAANSPAAMTQKANALEIIQARTNAVPAAVEQANTLLAGMSPSAIVRKAREQIPGTPEYQFVQLQHQIASNLALDDLRAVRESGLSLGRTNLAEFQASANAFANLDLGQDPALLSKNLSRLGSTYTQINANLTSDIARLRTGGQRTVTGPGGGSGYPGKVITPGQGGSIPYKSVEGFLRNTFPGGVDIGSEGRTPGQNKAAGGAAGSMHLDDHAADFTPKGPRWTQEDLDRFASLLDKKGIPHTELFIEDEHSPHSTGYHIHWGWGKKAGAASRGSDRPAAANLSDADLLKKYGL